MFSVIRNIGLIVFLYGAFLGSANAQDTLSVFEARTIYEGVAGKPRVFAHGDSLPFTGIITDKTQYGFSYAVCIYGRIVQEVYYDEDGEVHTVQYKDGDKRNGPFYKYYPNGRLSQVGYYLDGKMNGTWVYQDSLGNKIKEEFWKADSLISVKN